MLRVGEGSVQTLRFGRTKWRRRGTDPERESWPLLGPANNMKFSGFLIINDCLQCIAAHTHTHTQTKQRMHMEKFMLAFKMWPARQRNYAMWLLPLLLLPLALNPLAFVILFVSKLSIYRKLCVCTCVSMCLTYT